jgi:Tfp pilus assembly protein PilF
LQAHRNGLAIRERLAKIDPGNKDWQRALSFSVADVHEDQGNLLVSQGDLAGALKAFREALATLEYLAKAAPADSDRQRELLAGYRRVGDVLKNDLPDALAAYRNGLPVAERLVKSERDRAEWQRDLEEIADNLDRLAYQFLLVRDFANALAASDQAIASAPDRVSSYLNRAHALMFLGRADEARAVYLRYRAESDVQDSKSWVTVVLQNFGELRRAGLTNPLMKEIEDKVVTRGGGNSK